MGVDYWDVSKWEKELSEHDVIVCTAKIMENLLHMAYITMDKVLLPSPSLSILITNR